MIRETGIGALLAEIRAKSTTLPAPVGDHLRDILPFIETLTSETPSLDVFRSYSRQQKQAAKMLPRAAKVLLRAAGDLLQVGGEAKLSAKVRSFVRNWGTDAAARP